MSHQQYPLVFWVVLSNISPDLYPYLGKWSNLTLIFQMGWNHQLVFVGRYSKRIFFRFMNRDIEAITNTVCTIGLLSEVQWSWSWECHKDIITRYYKIVIFPAAVKIHSKIMLYSSERNIQFGITWYDWWTTRQHPLLQKTQTRCQNKHVQVTFQLEERALGSFYDPDQGDGFHRI